MVGPALKKFAKARALNLDGGFAYGELHGCRVALDDGPNIKRLFLFARFPDETQKETFDALVSGDAAAHFRIQSKEYLDNQIAFVFTDKGGTMTLIEEFLDWLLPQLPQLGMAQDVCAHCGAPTYGGGKWAVIDGRPLYLHESCLRSRSEIIRSNEARAKEALTGSYLTGFIGALLGGLLGSLVWAGLMYVGFIAGIVGFLIGFFAGKGYNLLKGRQGKGKVFVLIVVVLICVAVGTLLGEFVQCAKALHEEGLSDVPTMDFFRYLLDTEPEFRTAILKDFLLGLLFAGLGVAGLLVRAHKETADVSIKLLK